jgi:hypothetical protein
MTDKITPEAVKAARDGGTPGPWAQIDYLPTSDVFSISSATVHIADVHVDDDPRAEHDARLIAMAPDLATAYLALCEEIKHLRARVEAADQLAEAIEDDEWGNAETGAALTAYRATEDET